MSESKTEVIQALDKIISDLTALRTRTADLIARLERKMS